MKKELKSGIYIIENTINGKIYVGQSINLNRRWASHKSAYKRYSEGSESCWHQALWNAFDKYGVDKFEYKIVARCPRKYLNKMEIKFIQLYNSYNKVRHLKRLLANFLVTGFIRN